MADALDRMARELNNSFEVNLTLPQMRERLGAAWIAALAPSDKTLRQAVRAGMNAECPPGAGITDRGAELALIALQSCFQNAASKE